MEKVRKTQLLYKTKNEMKKKNTKKLYMRKTL